MLVWVCLCCKLDPIASGLFTKGKAGSTDRVYVNTNEQTKAFLEVLVGRMLAQLFLSKNTQCLFQL